MTLFTGLELVPMRLNVQNSSKSGSKPAETECMPRDGSVCVEVEQDETAPKSGALNLVTGLKMQATNCSLCPFSLTYSCRNFPFSDM